MNFGFNGPSSFAEKSFETVCGGQQTNCDCISSPEVVDSGEPHFKHSC